MRGRSFRPGRLIRPSRVPRSSKRKYVLASALVLAIGVAARLSEGSAQIALQEGATDAVTRESLDGEWTGVSVDGDVLLILRVDAAKALLAVSERETNGVVSTVYESRELGVEAGRVTFGRPEQGVVLDAQLSRTWGSGWGTGTLTLPNDQGPARRIAAYFFFRRDASWMTRMLQLMKHGSTRGADGGNDPDPSRTPPPG
jgi:hypothetical protein